MEDKAPNTSILRAENLVKVFGKRRVVDGLSLEVKQGEIIGLLGPNGAGKTTTFYMIVGLIKQDEGSVFIDKIQLQRMPMYRRAKLGIGYLSQEPSVFRKLTVAKNLRAILEFTNLSKKQQAERLEILLDELKIGHLRNQKAYTLSGGERRRVEIARALVTEPKFLLLDEPFAGIDPIVVGDLQNVVRELAQKGLGILITDHNVSEVLRIVDRAYIVYEGSILISGNAETLIADPKAREIYLGENFKG
ncbi:LPS export ABC transporter ATP-binding protein [bacterium]|nr:LPS export ABC transporter ATP-binding protein [bacterium]